MNYIEAFWFGGLDHLHNFTSAIFAAYFWLLIENEKLSIKVQYNHIEWSPLYVHTQNTVAN